MKTLIIALIALTGITAQAKQPDAKTVKVIYSVAKTFDIDAQDLIRIAYTESKFKVDAVRVNKNGTIDYGMFQVNSIHWTTSCKEFDIKTLKGNASCAAKLIKAIKARHGDTDINWLGRYHSKTP